MVSRSTPKYYNFFYVVKILSELKVIREDHSSVRHLLRYLLYRSYPEPFRDDWSNLGHTLNLKLKLFYFHVFLIPLIPYSILLIIITM